MSTWDDRPVFLLLGIRLGIEGVKPIYCDTVFFPPSNTWMLNCFTAETSQGSLLYLSAPCQASNPLPSAAVVAAHERTDDSDIEGEQRRASEYPRLASSHFTPPKRGRDTLIRAPPRSSV
jgi:hypothetical protein